MKKISCFYSIALALIATCASSVLYADQASRIKGISDSVLSVFQGKPTSKQGADPGYLRGAVHWKVIQCDKSPSVDVGDYHGYRIVFEHTIMGPAVLSQRAEMNRKEDLVIKGHDYMDIVLFPTSVVKHDIDKDKIPWLQLEQTYYSRAFYMGKGYGYHWFANTGVYYQDVIRTKLKLSGGDDRLPILFDALGVVDLGHHTASSAHVLLQNVGEKALPFIRKAIEEHMSDNPQRYISVLGYIPGDEATRLLQTLYVSDNKKAADAAAYALISKPFRESAKPQYLDMLQRGKYVDEIWKACVQFRWKDAIPSLELAEANPKTLHIYRNVYETKRLLENRPVSEALKDAEKTIMSLGNMQTNQKTSEDEVEQARKALLSADDKQYAAIIAASLAIYNTKANVKPVQAIGFELLRSMPKENVQPMIETLKTIYKSDKWNSFIKKVIAEFDSGIE